MGYFGLNALNCLWHLKLLAGVGALKLRGQFTEAGKWEFKFFVYF